MSLQTTKITTYANLYYLCILCSLKINAIYIHYVILKWFMYQRWQTLPWGQASPAPLHIQTGG